MRETVLIVEDDAALLRGLADNFAMEGYRVVTAADGETALAASRGGREGLRPALIVLDIMLPKINGYELCRLFRAEGLEVPIIMLTAKGQEEDVVLGLKLGADDYVTKPFGIRELLARAEAFLRRARGRDGKTFAFGEFVLDRGARTLMVGANGERRRVELTPKEYALLELLTRRQGRAFTRDEILRTVWGHNVFVTGRSVDRAVATLRAKLEDAGGKGTRGEGFVQTVREIGYRFEV